jgi:antitoxin ParD1/3/4
MSKIEVELPPALTGYVEAQVEAGLYKSASDVIEAAVRRAADEDWVEDEVKLTALREALAPGLADIESGRVRELALDEILSKARAGAPARE